MQPMQQMTALLFVSMAAAAGCASYPTPTEKMVSAEAAIRSAREVGAAKVPQAQLHVTLAQEQLAQAKKLMADSENQQAEALLGRAQADAELALSQAKEDNAKQDAQRALDEVKAVKEKLK